MKHILLTIIIASLFYSCSENKQETYQAAEDTIQTTKPEQVTYQSIKIGNQEWMKKNLYVTTFSNGEPITEALTWDEWDDLSGRKEPCFCRSVGKDFEKKYGFLYNWYAVNDPRGLAPKGWHIPSKSEWENLLGSLGSPGEAANKLKAAGGWNHEGNGDNSTGFTAKASGVLRAFSNQYYIGEYTMAEWWSSTEIDDVVSEAAYKDKPVSALVIYSKASNEKEICKLTNNRKDDGLSIRCISDKSSANDVSNTISDEPTSMSAGSSMRTFVVGSDKAYFYDLEDSTIGKRKAYMVKGDQFLLIETVNGMGHVKYTTPSGKEIEGYIKLSDIKE